MTAWVSALWPGFAGFAWPWLLAALPLPWLARRWLPVLRADGAALRVPWLGRLEAVAAGDAGRARARMPWIAYAAWCALCIAAARPQAWGEAVQPPQVGRDLMLALDLSGSMGEEDMVIGDRVVDRLTAAKAVLSDFLDRREGDRIGLVVFGQRAFAVTPLTADRDSVRAQLDDSVVGLAGRETAIGDALALATKRLAGKATPQRVVVLLTDGVNTAGTMDPEKAAEIARDAGVRVHTIAFGGDGSASLFGLSLPGGGREDIDEAGLQDIARTTGGRAFRARDTASLADAYAEIDRLEPVRRAGRAVRPRVEQYAWPLAIAFVLALASLAWPRRPAWTR